jgi:hypothetical protein
MTGPAEAAATAAIHVLPVIMIAGHFLRYILLAVKKFIDLPASIARAEVLRYPRDAIETG